MLARKRNDQMMQSFRQPERTWKPIFKVLQCWKTQSNAEPILNRRLHLFAVKAYVLPLSCSIVWSFLPRLRFLCLRSMPVENMFLWGSVWNTTPATVIRATSLQLQGCWGCLGFCLSLCLPVSLSLPCTFSSFGYNKWQKTQLLQVCPLINLHVEMPWIVWKVRVWHQVYPHS